MTSPSIADPGPNFRLSRQVWPVRYDVRLALDLDAWRHTGTVAITIDLRERTDTITLHALDLEITSARVEPAGGTADAARAPSSCIRAPRP